MNWRKKEKEFKPSFRMEDERDYLNHLLYDEAGIVEVYQIGDWQHLGNFHTDFIGQYIGDDLGVIPSTAEVRWEVMDAEDYANTLLANCSGNAEDYMCEETGKVLVVQFFVVDDEGEKKMKFTADEVLDIVRIVAQKHGVDVTSEDTDVWCCEAAGEEWESKEELISDFEVKYHYCKICGFETHLCYLRDGMCHDCWHEKYFECHDCHERHEMADLVIYERGCDQWNICKECAGGKHYVVCGCGDYATERKGDFTQPQEFVCDRCKNTR